MIKVLKLNNVMVSIDSSGTNFINTTNNHKYSIYTNSSGYNYISIFNKGKRKNYLVHRLVALAFIPNLDNKPQVNHIDEVITHNNYLNLEWSTSYENSHYGSHMDNVKASSQKSFGNKCVVISHNKGEDETKYFDSIRDAAQHLKMSNGSLVMQLNKYSGTYTIKRKNVTVSVIKDR